MDTRRLERFAPLTGALFLLVAILIFALEGGGIGTDDSRAEIVKYWTENDAKQMALAALTSLAAVLLVWFGASLREFLRRTDARSDRLPTLAFAGAAIAATGFLVAAAIEFTAADTAGDVPPEVTHTLSVLYSDFFFPMAGGFVLLNLATGLAILRGGSLPRWLGFLLVAVGILCLTPIGFIGFLLTLLWIGALGVVLFLRGTSDHDGAVGPGASAPGTVRPADAPGPPVTPGPPPSGGGTTPAGLA